MRRRPPKVGRNRGLFGMFAPPRMGPRPTNQGAGEALTGAKRRVWVLKAGRPSPVVIQVGSSDGQFTQVVSGELKENDRDRHRFDRAVEIGGRGMTTPPLIEFSKVSKIYGRGEAAIRALDHVDHGDPRARVRRHHGALRLRQVDGHEHSRLSRRAKRRRLSVPGHLDQRLRPRAADHAAPAHAGLRLPGLQSPAAHLCRRERRAAADLSRHAGRRASQARQGGTRPRRPRRTRAPQDPGALRRPAAARRHRPRHRHQGRRCCSPTSRPATSIRRPVSRSWT
jgi:hypothetical protein